MDRTIANAYIIRKELSNLRHAASECKFTNFISISSLRKGKSEKKFGKSNIYAYPCSVRNAYPGKFPERASRIRHYPFLKQAASFGVRFCFWRGLLFTETVHSCSSTVSQPCQSHSLTSAFHVHGRSRIPALLSL